MGSAESADAPRLLLVDKPGSRPGRGRRLTRSGSGLAAPDPAETLPETQAHRSLPWPVVLFCTTLFVPWIIKVGPLALSLYRIVLLVTIVPCLVTWISGKAGRIRIADVSLLLLCVWGTMSLAVIHGAATSLQSGGILFVETMGAYLLARCYIRDEHDFRNMVSLMFKVVVFLLPFALFEAVTTHNLILNLFAAVLPTPIDWFMPPRLGMRRVQAVLEHPILFGVCMSSIFAMVHLVLGYEKPPFQRWVRTGAVWLTAALSLSAGPISALMAQVLLLMWNWILRQLEARWKLLIGFLVFCVIAAKFVSSQSIPAFWISHFSFDEESAYYRILIWEFGSASALNHPFFGVGFNQWERPEWMPPSIDMFWLVPAVVYGIPAAIFNMVAFLSPLISAGRRKGLSPKLVAYRTGYIISMVGFFLVGWTVHFWNATYVLYLFLLGSGVWLTEAPATDAGSGRGRSGRSEHAKERPRIPLRPAGTSDWAREPKDRAGARRHWPSAQDSNLANALRHQTRTSPNGSKGRPSERNG